MKVRFYVSEDGEVLSNWDFPVKSPMLVLPDKGGMPPIPCNAASELALTDLRFKTKLFRAITVNCPDDLFETKDGIITPAPIKGQDESTAPERRSK